jgi:hypothetical protein
MTTYYVDGLNGSDSNDGLSEANAWATIDKAMNTAQTAGDLVYVQATATYDENANIDVAGTAASPICYEGYTTTPGALDGRPVWKNSSGIALTDTTAASYYVFKHFDFDGSSGNGTDLGQQIVFFDCIFRNNGGDGAAAAGMFLFCESYSNSVYGLDIANSNSVIMGCICRDNSQYQIDLNGNTFLYKNLVYGTSGFNLINNAGFDDQTVIACTCDGENSLNTCFSNTNRKLKYAVCDNIFYDKATGASNTDLAQSIFWHTYVGNNLVNSNTTNYSGFTGVTAITVGLNDQTAAPQFADEANHDYTPDTGSPLLDAAVVPGLYS